MNFTGEIIAMFTVFSWAVAVQFIEVASKKVGSSSVNIIRISIAIGFFCIILFVKQGYNETYAGLQWTGMFITLSGVCMVILEKGNTKQTHTKMGQCEICHPQQTSFGVYCSRINIWYCYSCVPFTPCSALYVCWSCFNIIFTCAYCFNPVCSVSAQGTCVF